MIGEFEERPFK